MKRLVTGAEMHSWNSCCLSGAPHLTLKMKNTQETHFFQNVNLATQGRDSAEG